MVECFALEATRGELAERRKRPLSILSNFEVFDCGGASGATTIIIHLRTQGIFCRVYTAAIRIDISGNRMSCATLARLLADEARYAGRYIIYSDCGIPCP